MEAASLNGKDDEFFLLRGLDYLSEILPKVKFHHLAELDLKVKGG